MPNLNAIQTGRILQINVSPGGAPKRAIQRQQVHALGLADDAQATPEIHGGVERAVTLYSLELILALQAEGHPIYPGATGENLTIAGLDWARLQPGLRLRLGETVLIELTRYGNPCKKIGPAFRDGDSTRIQEAKYPGWSRWCARVLQPGEIAAGDVVEVV